MRLGGPQNRRGRSGEEKRFLPLPRFEHRKFQPLASPYTYYVIRTTRSKITELIYLLTPWSRVLLEKLTGSQLVKKFPAFYPKVHHCFYKSPSPIPILSQINPVHAPHPTSWRTILILSSHLCLGLKVVSSPHVSPPNPVCTPPLPSHREHTPAYRLLQLLCTYSPLHLMHWWSHHNTVYRRWQYDLSIFLPNSTPWRWTSEARNL